MNNNKSQFEKDVSQIGRELEYLKEDRTSEQPVTSKPVELITRNIVNNTINSH